MNRFWLAIAMNVVLGSLSLVSAQATSNKPNVAILIFDGVQIIDYTGPYEVFGSWGRRHVYTVAEKSDPITTAMGMRVIPNYTFENQPPPDVIVVPGGGGVNEQIDNQTVLNWIRENSKQAKYVMSVCNGAYLLGKAGLLDGLEATTTASLIDGLKTVAPKTKLVFDKRFVDNGKIITTAGLSSGIDGALHLVEKMDGKGWAQAIAFGIEYNWQPDSGYARANFADMKLPGSIYDILFPGAEPGGMGGSPDSWEEKWQVPSSSSPTDFLRKLNEKWATDARWKRADVTSHAESQLSKWWLSDASGRIWDASAKVETSSVPNRLMLTLKIARRSR